MKIEDMKLTIVESARAAPNSRPKTRDNRQYIIEGLKGERILIPDLAARIGRKPTSIYQMLKVLPAGLHIASFQDIVKRSMNRTSAPRRNWKHLIADVQLFASVESMIQSFVHCAPTCALERWTVDEARKARTIEQWRLDKIEWLREEAVRKEERKLRGLDAVPVIQPPRKPEYAPVMPPPCNCGRVAAVEAVREAMGACEVLDAGVPVAKI